MGASVKDHKSELPRLGFFQIAAETPVVILDGMVFYLAENPTGEDPCFLFEDTCFGLVPSQSLLDIERQYGEIFENEIEQYKIHYLRECVDKRIETFKDVQRKLAENQVLTFLVTKMMPKLQELYTGKAPMTQPRREKREPNMQRPLGFQTGPRRRTSSILPRVIGRNVVILDHKVYPLVPVNPLAGGDLILRSGGAIWGLAKDCRFLRDLESYCLAKLCRFLEEQALSETPDRMRLLQEIESAEQAMKAYQRLQIASTRGDVHLYQDKEYGILRRNGVWYVYVEVPEYVVEDADGTLYRFDAVRVGVPINNHSPEIALTPGTARVLAPYEHMFVQSKTANAGICMAKGSAYYGALRQMPLREALCLYLHDAKQTLMAGHHAGNGTRPYHRISSFPKRRISRQEAMDRDLPIYPYRR